MTTRSDEPADTGATEHSPETAMVPADTASTEAPVPTTTEDSRHHGKNSHQEVPDTTAGLLGSAWVGLVLGALVTILLLIFIAQNTTSTDVQFLGLHFSLPLGVLVLLSAIVGALIMALFAGFRILQLRMRARKARKLARRSR